MNLKTIKVLLFTLLDGDHLLQQSRTVGQQTSDRGDSGALQS